MTPPRTPAFIHDVFLSHSAKDKAVVRPLAERLRKDGLKVQTSVKSPIRPDFHRNWKSRFFCCCAEGKRAGSPGKNDHIHRM